MFILVENQQYVDGERKMQLVGTYNHFEDAHAAMYGLYKDELGSDEEYDEDWCEVLDDFAQVSGEGGFPREITWFVFDSDNPKSLLW